MALPAADGVALLIYAAQQREEERLFARWIAGAQYTMSFEDFKSALQPPKFKDEEELMADVEHIIDGGRNGDIQISR